MSFSAEKRFDIIVVGAGPAGSSAALAAAQEGVSVLLLEEDSEVGEPLACAEGLSQSTIKGYLEIKPEWVSRELSGAVIRGPHREEFRIDYPDVGWVLDRIRFDQALAQMAQEQGAVLKTGAKAIGINDGRLKVMQGEKLETYRFKFIIGADGISSNVGRWFGIDTRLRPSELEVCAEYLLEDIEFDNRSAYLIFGEQYAPGGYAWIFPKSERSANVGLGITPTRTKLRAKQLLDNWIQREFPGVSVKKRIFGGVPAKVLKRFSGKNFFLVGDAARFTDPLSGAGIANAVKSGIIGGKNAVLRLKGKKDHFVSAINHIILKEVKFHHRVRNVYIKLDDDKLMEIFKIGKRVYAGRRVDDINTRTLVREILLSSPVLLKLGFTLLFT